MTLTHLHQVELARRWRMSPRTLERWRWLGLGPQHIKIGGRMIYRLEDIELLRLPTCVTAPARWCRGSERPDEEHG